MVWLGQKGVIETSTPSSRWNKTMSNLFSLDDLTKALEITVADGDSDVNSSQTITSVNPPGNDDFVFFGEELIGGAGDDTLTGGAGNDTIQGNGGRDKMDGGSVFLEGVDAASFDASSIELYVEAFFVPDAI